MDEFDARELAASLRIAVSADAVAAWSDGDRAKDQLCRMMTEALGQAEAGMLTAGTIAAIHRYSKGRPRVLGWCTILRHILDAQGGTTEAQRPRQHRWTYAIDPRRWTPAERDEWQREYPDYPWSRLLEKWDETVGYAQAEKRRRSSR
jgi:hypothetical protein